MGLHELKKFIWQRV